MWAKYWDVLLKKAHLGKEGQEPKPFMEWFHFQTSAPPLLLYLENNNTIFSGLLTSKYLTSGQKWREGKREGYLIYLIWKRKNLGQFCYKSFEQVCFKAQSCLHKISRTEVQHPSSFSLIIVEEKLAECKDINLISPLYSHENSPHTTQGFF